MSNKNINVKISPQFTEASERENINSGDNIKTVFGKIKKWLSDLKPVAFSGSYNDLTDKTMTGYTKPASTSAITASDTINQAIGKLEKGLEDAGSGSSELEEHIETNVEDEGGVHGIRCYNGKLEVFNAYSEEWLDPSEVGVAVGNVSNLTIGQGNLSLILYWSDPANTADATWKGTKVVMKVGSYPESVTDGQLVCDNQVRDNYSTTGLTVNNLTEGTTYYFQLFPYTTTGTITIDDSNRISGIVIHVYELGIEIDFRSRTYTRLGDAVGLSSGSDFDGFPMYKRRRCNLADNGTVNAYLGDSGYKTDGTNGQVMVEQPKFYYKIEVVSWITSPYKPRKVRYWVSNTLHDDFKLHPAFINKNNHEIDYFYEGAYEGYVTDNKLCSISGVTPTTGQAIDTFRTQAARGYNNKTWMPETVLTMSAVQLLMIIEYGRMNLQSTLGYGCVSANASLNTGTLDSYGNASFGDTTDKISAVMWRGKENPWGNIETFVDGISYNYYSSTLYIMTGYDYSFNGNLSIGFSPPTSNYISAFGYNSTVNWAFIPIEANSSYGDSSGPVGDFHFRYNYSSGTGHYSHGGGLSSNLYAGPFCLTLSQFSSGSRLVYVNQS